MGGLFVDPKVLRKTHTIKLDGEDDIVTIPDGADPALALQRDPDDPQTFTTYTDEEFARYLLSIGKRDCESSLSWDEEMIKFVRDMIIENMDRDHRRRWTITCVEEQKMKRLLDQKDGAIEMLCEALGLRTGKNGEWVSGGVAG